MKGGRFTPPTRHVPELLYHWTSLINLAQIVRDGEIRLTTRTATGF